MTTGLERIAAKARCEPKLRFTSLAHHVTRDRVWGNLCRIPRKSAPGTDGQTVAEAKETFEDWIEPMLGSVHRKGYRAPTIRRVYIPKPGKREKRPLGVPCISDRALQRSTAQVLAAITLREKFIKIGAKFVCRGCDLTFRMAEAAIPRALFANILRLIDGLRPAPLSP